LVIFDCDWADPHRGLPKPQHQSTINNHQSTTNQQSKISRSTIVGQAYRRAGRGETALSSFIAG
jgi:hypothetical protein